MTIMTQEEIINSIIPEMTIEEVTFESNPSSNDGLRVRVRFSISDISENDAISQWFRNEQYEKYFLVTSKLLYTRSANQVEPNEVRGESINITNIPEQQIVHVTDSDGKDVVKFVFEETWNFQGEVASLSFQGTTGFDLQAMENDIGIDLSFLDDEMEKVKNIPILDNSRIVFPIQDFRERGASVRNPYNIDTESADYSLEEYSQRYREAARLLEENVNNASDFLSDFWIARSAQGDAKFLFILDAFSFYEKKSEYRKYFKRLTDEEKRVAIASIIVSSLKVKRKRVKVIKTPNGKETVEFDRNYPIEVVAETSKKRGYDGFGQVITDKGAIKQIDISEVGNDNLYFITGTDYKTSDLSDGIYAYGVSVEFVDTMKNTLLGKINNLRESTKLLREAYNIITLPRNYDSYNKVFVRSSREMLDEYRDSDNVFLRTTFFNSHVELYNEVLRIFTEGFSGEDSSSIMSKLASLRLRNSSSNQSLPEVMQAAIEISDILMSNALADIGEPSGSVYEEINIPPSNLIIESEKYYETPEKLFDANVPKFNGLEYLANFSESTDEEVLRELSTLASDEGEVGLKVIDGATFQGRIGAEINKFFRTEILETTIPVLSETPTSSRINLNGPGSEFLTLSAFMDGMSETDATSNSSVFRDINDVSAMTNALSRNIYDQMNNVGRIRGEVLGPPRDADREEASFFAKLNVAFSSLVSRTLVQRDSGIGRSDVFNLRIDPEVELERQETEFREVRANARRKQEFEKFVFSKFINILSTPNLGTEKTLANTSFPDIENELSTTEGSGSVWESMAVSRRGREFENAPNVVKAFSLLDSPDIRLNQIPENGAYKVSLDFLVSIEYLSGFENGMVSSPIWKPLTADAYSRNSNRNLVCRMSSAHIERLGVRATATGKPIFDSCFIIKPVANFDLDIEPQVAVSLGETQEQIERNRELQELGSATVDMMSTVLDSLRSQLREKTDKMRANKAEIERLEAEIEEIEEILQGILDNPDSWDYGEGAARSMKPDVKFGYNHWLRTIGGANSGGLLDQKLRLVNENILLQEQADRIREDLRRREGTNIPRLNL